MSLYRVTFTIRPDESVRLYSGFILVPISLINIQFILGDGVSVIVMQ